MLQIQSGQSTASDSHRLGAERAQVARMPGVWATYRKRIERLANVKEDKAFQRTGGALLAIW